MISRWLGLCFVVLLFELPVSAGAVRIEITTAESGRKTVVPWEFADFYKISPRVALLLYRAFEGEENAWVRAEYAKAFKGVLDFGSSPLGHSPVPLGEVSEIALPDEFYKPHTTLLGREAGPLVDRDAFFSLPHAEIKEGLRVYTGYIHQQLVARSYLRQAFSKENETNMKHQEPFSMHTPGLQALLSLSLFGYSDVDGPHGLMDPRSVRTEPMFFEPFAPTDFAGFMRKSGYGWGRYGLHGAAFSLGLTRPQKLLLGLARLGRNIQESDPDSGCERHLN